MTGSSYSTPAHNRTALTPAALVDLYGGEIVTGSSEHQQVRDDLAGMTLADVRAVERMAPEYSRLACLARVEAERRAAAKLRLARRRAARAAAATAMPVRTERVEEV